MIKVLFVCAGNICRSPMAEGVFQEMVRQAGLADQIMVDSAGTGSWHVGEPAHPRTQAILKDHLIPYDGRARQFKQEDIGTFDYVLAMDEENLSDMLSKARGLPDAHIRLFLSYANAAGLTSVTEVPDPYYSGVYDQVYALVKAGGEALLNHIRRTHQL